MSAQYEQTQDSQSGIWQRLNSWWDNGGDDGAQAAGIDADDADDAGPGQFPDERLRVLSGMFGSGCASLWPEQQFQALMDKCDFEPTSRILVLGSGPGGAAHLLAEVTGSKVMAIDDRIEMADIGQDWLRRAGSSVKFDRRDFYETDIRPGFADLIVALEGLSHLKERRRLFRHLMNILRPRGRIVFEDFFITGQDPECPEVAVWSALEDRPHHLTDKARFSDMIYDIGFDYPDFEDRTEAHTEDIRNAFQRGLEMMQQAGAKALHLKPFFVEEVNRWNRRLALLQSGEARYYRVTVEYFGKSAVV